jgi:hypothetical protein
MFINDYNHYPEDSNLQSPYFNVDYTHSVVGIPYVCRC